MKKILLGAVAALATMGASAQELPTWTLKVSYDVTMPTDWHANDFSNDMFKAGSGFSVGFSYIQPLGLNFYLEPGASVFYDTYRYKDLMLDLSQGDIITRVEDPSVKKCGLRVPVYVGYRLGLPACGLSVFTGPELQYAFSGHLGVDDSLVKDGENSLFSDNSLSPQQRFNCGWGVGLGIDTGHFFATLTYNFGLTNVYNGDIEDGRYRENKLYITWGYKF